MDANALPDHLDHRVLKARLDHLENRVLPDLLARVDHLEKLALKENQGLQDLLARLENVITSARQFWYHKTTLLHWMIIILVLIVMDRLLSHFPQIVTIVEKLL